MSISQTKNEATLLPMSIYHISQKSTDLDNKYTINKMLNFNSYRFVKLDLRNFNDGYLSVPFWNDKNPPTELIYDSFKKFSENIQLQKSFFKVADLYKVRERNKN